MITVSDNRCSNEREFSTLADVRFAQNFYLLRKYSEIHAANGERGRIDYQRKSLQKINVLC